MYQCFKKYILRLNINIKDYIGKHYKRNVYLLNKCIQLSIIFLSIY